MPLETAAVARLVAAAARRSASLSTMPYNRQRRLRLHDSFDLIGLIQLLAIDIELGVIRIFHYVTSACRERGGNGTF